MPKYSVCRQRFLQLAVQAILERRAREGDRPANPPSFSHFAFPLSRLFSNSALGYQNATGAFESFAPLGWDKISAREAS